MGWDGIGEHSRSRESAGMLGQLTMQIDENLGKLASKSLDIQGVRGLARKESTAQMDDAIGYIDIADASRRGG
jgi:hypothetical protein